MIAVIRNLPAPSLPRYALGQTLLILVGFALGVTDLRAVAEEHDQPKRIEADITIFEIEKGDLDALGIAGGPPAVGATPSDRLREGFATRLQELKLEGTVKALFQNPISFDSDSHFVFGAGTEAPLIREGKGGALWVEYRELGTYVFIRGERLEDSRLRLKADATFSDEVPGRSFVMDETKFPAIKSRTLAFECTMSLDEDVLLNFGGSGLEESETYWMMLVRPR